MKYNRLLVIYLLIFLSFSFAILIMDFLFYDYFPNCISEYLIKYIFPMVIILYLIIIFCIIHVFLRKDFSLLKKFIWVFLLILANWLACIIYLRDDIFYATDKGKN